ncbi:unnamed protein product [Heligmosomoides polygyrus]|uniref:HTH_48 domain-containing protein n=1 Tax=Heligmosomoides polygyrus TaxID=6339 RepID=A0A183GLZ5_HELPZ|nr:unnamed protein product [Heligmosomoides polygyrus]
MSTISSSSLRPIAYYEFLQGHSAFARTAASNICASFKEKVIHYSTVARWYQRFKAGDISLQDQPRFGRPSVVEEGSSREAFKSFAMCRSAANHWATRGRIPTELDSKFAWKHDNGKRNERTSNPAKPVRLGGEVPSASTCSLTTDVLVVVYHASEGAVRNKRQVIVSATYSTTTDSVGHGFVTAPKRSGLTRPQQQASGALQRTVQGLDTT